MQQAHQISTPVWQMRAVMNWIKQVLVKELVEEGSGVVGQWHSHHALDYGKWERQKVAKFVGIERDDKATADAQTRWKMKNNFIPSAFHSAANLSRLLSTAPFELDVALRSLDAIAAFNGLDEVAFESTASLEETLRLVSDLLKESGFFFGLVIDSSELWTKMLKLAPKNSFSTSKGLAHARFENLQQLNTAVTDIDIYGISKFTSIKYQFTLEHTAVHFLVHFPSFIRTAWKFGLRLVESTNCAEFYDDHREDYVDMMKKLGVHPKNKFLPEQREVLALYTTFVFKKEATQAHEKDAQAFRYQTRGLAAEAQPQPYFASTAVNQPTQDDDEEDMMVDD